VQKNLIRIVIATVVTATTVLAHPTAVFAGVIWFR
jgi:hypothetical protein